VSAYGDIEASAIQAVFGFDKCVLKSLDLIRDETPANHRFYPFKQKNSEKSTIILNNRKFFAVC